MTGVDLIVPIGDQGQQSELPDAATEEAQQFDSRTVRPVGVFGNEDGWPALVGQSLQHGAEELVPAVAIERVAIGRDT